MQETTTGTTTQEAGETTTGTTTPNAQITGTMGHEPTHQGLKEAPQG